MRVYLIAALIAVFLLLPACGESRRVKICPIPTGAKLLWEGNKGWSIFQFGEKKYLHFCWTGKQLGFLGFAEYKGPIPPTGKGE